MHENYFSGEFESPCIKYSKTDTNCSSSEELTSGRDDITVNNASIKKHSTESIFITEDDLANEKYLDNYKDEDYLTWVSHTKGNIFLT